MTLRVVFRESADADLDAVFDYISKDDFNRAIAFIRRIRGRCIGLADFPEAGRRRDDLEFGLRTVAFERRVVIVYAISAYAVEIIRVLYGGRDIDALLSSDE